MPPGCSGAGRPENRVTARSGAPQKQMHGAALPDEAGAEHLEHAIGLGQDPPEPVRVRTGS